MIKDPFLTRQIGGRCAVILCAVDVPADGVRLPFYAIGVEGVGNWLAQVIDATEAAATGIAGTVDGAKDAVRQPTDLFHIVNFASLRPVNFADICPQTPERGPESYPHRHFDTCLDLAVGKLKAVTTEQPGRSVLARTIITKLRTIRRAHGDGEIAPTIGRGIVGAVGVIFQLTVAPARIAVGSTVADFMAPIFRIGPCVGRRVKLITPDQCPTCRPRIGGPVIFDLQRHHLAAVRAIVPEAQRLGIAPILSQGKVMADAGRTTPAARDLKNMLKSTLCGQRQCSGSGDLRVV